MKIEKLDEQKKKNRKKKSTGMSWYERVKIQPGDERPSIDRFNNSVNFQAISPEGANIVSTDGSGMGATASAGGGMGESLQEDNGKSREELIARYYSPVLDEYAKLRDYVRDAGKKYYSLKTDGYDPSGELYKNYKAKRDRMTAIEVRFGELIPADIKFRDILKIYDKLAHSQTNMGLTDEEVNQVKNIFSQAKIDKLTPSKNQLFKFSYAPKRYLVDKVENNIVYYIVDGGDYRSEIPLDEFIKKFKSGEIYYLNN